MSKKWIILLSAIIVVTAGIFVYFRLRGSKDFEPLIKEKLQQAIQDGSDSLYILNLDRITVDVVNSQVIVTNARLDIDSNRLRQLDERKQAPDDIYKITLRNLVIEGINVNDLLNKNAIDLKTLYINEPVVEIYHHERTYNYTPPDTTSLYKKIARQIGHFSLTDLIVKDIDFTHYNVADKNKVTKFTKLNASFRDILIDSGTQNDSTRFLYAKDAAISLNDYSISTADSLYIFHIDSLTLNAGARNLELINTSLKPRGAKKAFSSKLKFYKDRYDIAIDKISLQKVDWWNLLAREGFNAGKMILADGNVEVFADRTLPDEQKDKVGNYPHQILTRLKLPVRVDNIDIRNITVTYTELNQKTGRTGSIIFADVQGKFSNVTNIETAIEQNPFLTLEANAQLMNTGPLHALFKFDLHNADKGVFALDVEIGKMNGTALNVATKTLGLFEIKSADIDKIIIHMTANDFNSRGTVAFYYDNLKVEVLKRDDNNGKLKKQGLITFLANSFIIEKSNKEGDKNSDPKKVSYKRDPKKSFFNLIWKTIFTGLGDTIKGKND